MTRLSVLAATVFIALVLLLAPMIERIGISGLWYLQDRSDVTNYSAANASAELLDSHNIVWLNQRVGY